MSTILKALRRVEEAHGADQPKPALEGDWLGDGSEAAAPPEADEPAPRSLRKAWPMLASALAGFGLVLSGAWLWSQRPVETVASSPEPAAVVATAVSAQQVTPEVEFEAEPAVAADISAEVVSQVQQRLREAAEQAAETAPTPATIPVVSEARTAQPVPAAAAPAPFEIIPEPTRSPKPAPVVARSEPEPAAPRPRTPSEAPRSSEPERPATPAAAKPAERPALVAVVPSPPEIWIERTRWHPTPQKRTARVSIAGVVHDVRESDDIDGLRVVEIRPSTVVFTHNGIRIERTPGR